MLRKIAVVMITLSVLVLASPGNAQENSTPTLVALHHTGDGSVVVFDDSTGTTTELLAADAVPADAFVRGALSPTVDYAAVLVEQVNDALYRSDNDDFIAGTSISEQGLTNTLYIFDLSNNEIVVQRETFPDDFQLPAEWFPGTNPILNTDIVPTWSPDGRRLLWLEGTPYRTEAARNGFGRLVLFDTTDLSVTALPMHAGTPFDLHWSPNGQYAIYQAISNFGTGAGYNGEGTYVLLPDNTVREMPLPQEDADDIVPLGWLADNTFVFSMFSILAGGEGLFVYDPATDALTTLIDIQQQLDADANDIHPESGQIVVTLTDFVDQAGPLEAGTYLFRNASAEPVLLIDRFEFSGTVPVVQFVSANTLYVATFSPGTFRGTVDLTTGEIIPLEGTQRFVPFDLIGNDFMVTEGDDGMNVQLFQTEQDGGASYTLPISSTEAFTWLSNSVFVDYLRVTPTEIETATTVFVGTTAGDFKTVTVAEDGYILDVQIE